MQFFRPCDARIQTSVGMGKDRDRVCHVTPCDFCGYIQPWLQRANRVFRDLLWSHQHAEAGQLTSSLRVVGLFIAALAALMTRPGGLIDLS